MPFNKALDKELFRTEVEGANDSILIVSVNAYNDGEAKVNIGPRIVTYKNGNTGFRKLGRLTVDEMDNLIPAITEARAFLDTV